MMSLQQAVGGNPSSIKKAWAGLSQGPREQAKKMSQKLPGGGQVRGSAGRARLSAGVAGPVKGVRQEPVADPGVQVRGDPDTPGFMLSLCYPLQAPSISQVEISLVLESEAGSN